MADAQIGIRVFLDDLASGGLFNINNQLARMGQLATGTGQSFQQMSLASQFVTGGLIGSGIAFAAFAGGIKYSVDSAIQFQNALFQLAVATHVPYQEAQSYTQALMNLGATSTFTTADIVTGISALGRSGYTLHDIMTQFKTDIPSVAQTGIMMSIAIGTDAVSGFKLLAQVMSAYHTPAIQAINDANLIQWAFEHQRGSVADFASGMSQVTPEAARFNVGLNEIGPALDVVSSSMASTSRAGTALRYMLDGIYSPTDAGKKEMIALGLASVDAGGNFHSAFFDAKGNAIDFMKAVQLLHEKMATLTEQKQIDALHAMFSVRGGQGVEVTLKQFNQLNDYLKQLIASDNNAGMVQERFNEKMALLQPNIQALQTSFTDLAAAIGLALMPALTNIIKFANTLISQIRTWAVANPQLAASFMLIGAAVSGISFVAFLAAFLVIHSELAAIIGIALGVAVGLAAITAAIMAVTRWFQSLHINAELVHNVLMTIATVLSLVAGSFLRVPLLEFAGGLGRILIGAIGLAPNLLTIATNAARLAGIFGVVAINATLRFAGSLSTLIPTLLRAGISAATAAIPFILMNAGIILIIAAIALAVVGLGLLIRNMGGLAAIVNAGRAVWAVFLPVLEQVANQIRGALTQAINQLRPVWQQLVVAFAQAGPVLLVLGRMLGGVLLAALAVILAGLVGVVRGLAMFVVGLLTALAGVARFVAGVLQFFLGLFTAIHGLLTGNSAEFQAGWRNMCQGVLNIVQGAWQAIKGVFIAVFGTIIGFVSGFVSTIIGFFHALSNTLVGHSIVPDMMNAIRNVITSVLSGLISTVSGWVGNVISVFTHAGTTVSAVMTTAFNLVRSIVTNVLAGILALISGNMAQAQARFSAAGAAITGAMNAAMSMVRGAVTNGLAAVMGLFGGLPGRIVGALAGLAGMLFNSGATAMQMFANGLTSALGAVVSAVANAAGQVANFLAHHSPAKMGPLSDDDRWMGNMMNMFANDIQKHTPMLARATSGVAGNIASIPSQARAAMSGGAMGVGGFGGGGVRTATYNLVFDGKVLTTIVMDNLTGQLQLNGMGRALR